MTLVAMEAALTVLCTWLTEQPVNIAPTTDKRNYNQVNKQL